MLVYCFSEVASTTTGPLYDLSVADMVDCITMVWSSAPSLMPVTLEKRKAQDFVFCIDQTVNNKKENLRLIEWCNCHPDVAIQTMCVLAWDSGKKVQFPQLHVLWHEALSFSNAFATRNFTACEEHKSTK